jgi:hypothetical protein
MNNAYRIASGLIIAGFVMLCQPFAKVLFEWGFSVLLAGVFLFLILDHIPAASPHKEDDRG